MDDAQKVQERAREIIERARREHSEKLDLSIAKLGGRLEEIPDEVFNLRQLENLILQGNSIREVPEKIRRLSNLLHLDLVRNPIERLPDIPGLALDWSGYQRCKKALSRQNVEQIWIFFDKRGSLRINRARGSQHRLVSELALLSRLRELGVSPLPGMYANMVDPTEPIRNLIDDIGRLNLLESLTFTGIAFEEVPYGIRNLKRLKTLRLLRAGLREIPDWLGELGHLEDLNLRGNDLANLPTSLEALPGLKAMNLGENLFTEIPQVVFRLQSLARLDVSSYGNSRRLIKKISEEVLQLPNLNSLDVDGQPIEVPPPEIVKEGVEAIKNYWRQQREVGIDYLCEAKLIIVGEAGAGKTTLARKIQNPDYKLQPQERSTEGIDVLRWSFPAALRVKKDGREELLPSDFKVNIWDFGGQEIYHATHQFFLTRRSLYVLVSDDRKEDTDFNYWLQVVELLSDRSPLLIVQNEKQNRQRDLDLGKLRADFPSLREAFRTNLATNRGLSDLERAIRQALEYLPHIGTPLPKTWSRVRTALESDKRNYISLEEYLAICQEHGFERREDKLQLSGYLHDLGIFLHFQDDPVLKNIVILKPKWGTNAVYRVLDDRTVLVDQRGRFTAKDLARIWSDEAYASMRDELLRLMMKFQLCYQLPGAEAYIAPQLLSPAQPDYPWDSFGGLVLRYDYDFMPKGILTRFIVALSHLIAEQSLVWKSGVILAREGSRGEVIEDYPRRKITVRVGGADSRSLLAIVDDQLDRIHSSFPRLKYERFLPCNCKACQAQEEPFAYPLNKLKEFATQGKKIQCWESGELVDAAHLIRDVLPSAVYSPEFALELSDGRLLRPDLPPPAEPAPRKEVFVSYAWTDASTAIVDKLQEAFKERDVTLVRDKNEMRYKDSIRGFMERIGRGKCIVVVLSKRYLESKSCMFEMTEIAERGEIRGRVFPIVLEDAGIYEGINRVRYIKYWEQKRDELDAEMKEVGGEYLQGIREELDLFAKIRGTIAGIVEILGDMNALSPDQHQESSFDSLLEALEARLGD